MAAVTGLGVFFIIVGFVLLISVAGWLIYTHLRARRLGLPTPTLQSYNPFANREPSYGSSNSSGGVMGWINKKLKRNDRSAGGAYEEPLNSNIRGRGRGRGGFGPLDPDEAWDARVGTEADAYGPGGYYEEQELGLHGDSRVAATPGLAPAGYGNEAPRGRSLSREPEPYIGGSQRGLDARYDEETGRTGAVGKNPFDDDVEPSNVSLRGVSPRPITTDGPSVAKGHKKTGSADSNSPTERRSMFRENM